MSSTNESGGTRRDSAGLCRPQKQPMHQTRSAVDLFAGFRGDEHRPYRLVGGAPSALLVHGFPGTPAEMRPLAVVLNEMGWTVQGLLLPGFGPDINALERVTSRDWADAIHTALRDLRRNHSEVLLIGHSMGGALSLSAAACDPPTALILLSPFCALEAVLPIPWLWPLYRRIKHRVQPFALFNPDFDDPRVRARVCSFLPGVDLNSPSVRQAILEFSIPTRIIHEALWSAKQGCVAARKVTVPVLIIQGAYDPLVRVERTRQLAARIPGDVAVREVPGKHDLPQPSGSAWPMVREHVVAFASRVATGLS